jgi:hypothetical protein
MSVVLVGDEKNKRQFSRALTAPAWNAGRWIDPHRGIVISTSSLKAAETRVVVEVASRYVGCTLRFRIVPRFSAIFDNHSQGFYGATHGNLGTPPLQLGTLLHTVVA